MIPLKPFTTLIMLLLGVYLLGLFQVLILPPFEGFDETAHYSYLQQIALTGTWPRHGQPMSADIDDYLKVAPTATSMNPSWTYDGFFAASREVIAAGRAMIHAQLPEPRSWRAGTIVNWEAQHPPLYYALLAPAFRLAAHWSLGGRLLLLRAISYTLSWLGLCMAAFAAMPHIGDRDASLTPTRLAPALWPLLLPMWFPEMARLGNDSLVTLMAGFVCLFVNRSFQGGGSRANFLAIGIGLGLGLLTKATFLPLTVGVFVILAFRAFRDTARPGFERCLDLATLIAATLVIAGWWYGEQMLQTGSPIGSNDAIELSHGISVAGGLHQHLTLSAFFRMLGSFELSFVVWTGTWSLTSPPFLTLLPLLLGGALLIVYAVWFKIGQNSTLRESLALLTLILFFLALVYQSMILMAVVGSPAPAWYLHSYVAVLWPLLAWSVAGALKNGLLTRILWAQIVYSLAYILLAVSAEIMFFTGCAVKPELSHYLDFSKAGACIADPGLVFERLAVIAFPGLGLVCFVTGFGLLATGSIGAMRAMIQSRATVQP